MGLRITLPGFTPPPPQPQPQPARAAVVTEPPKVETTARPAAERTFKGARKFTDLSTEELRDYAREYASRMGKKGGGRPKKQKEPAPADPAAAAATAPPT